MSAEALAEAIKRYDAADESCGRTDVVAVYRQHDELRRLATVDVIREARLLAQQHASDQAEAITEPVEPISFEEFARREGPNWAGVDAVAHVRALRGDTGGIPAQPDALREKLEALATKWEETAKEMDRSYDPCDDSWGLWLAAEDVRATLALTAKEP